MPLSFSRVFSHYCNKSLERKIGYKSSQSLSCDWANFALKCTKQSLRLMKHGIRMKRVAAPSAYAMLSMYFLLILWAAKTESSCFSRKMIQNYLIERMIAHTINKLHARTMLLYDATFIFCFIIRKLWKERSQHLFAYHSLVEKFAYRRDRVMMRNMTQTGLMFKVSGSIYFSHWDVCFYWFPGNSLYRLGGRDQC